MTTGDYAIDQMLARYHRRYSKATRVRWANFTIRQQELRSIARAPDAILDRPAPTTVAECYSALAHC
jgi:hypothetical protein